MDHQGKRLGCKKWRNWKFVIKFHVSSIQSECSQNLSSWQNIEWIWHPRRVQQTTNWYGKYQSGSAFSRNPETGRWAFKEPLSRMGSDIGWRASSWNGNWSSFHSGWSSSTASAREVLPVCWANQSVWDQNWRERDHSHRLGGILGDDLHPGLPFIFPCYNRWWILLYIFR